jgi:hypothetical protein
MAEHRGERTLTAQLVSDIGLILDSQTEAKEIA